jgi:hypothetical protein
MSTGTNRSDLIGVRGPGRRKGALEAPFAKFRSSVTLSAEAYPASREDQAVNLTRAGCFNRSVPPRLNMEAITPSVNAFWMGVSSPERDALVSATVRDH